jgi:hypothetical protein
MFHCFCRKRNPHRAPVIEADLSRRDRGGMPIDRQRAYRPRADAAVCLERCSSSDARRQMGRGRPRSIPEDVPRIMKHQDRVAAGKRGEGQAMRPCVLDREAGGCGDANQHRRGGDERLVHHLEADP